MLTNKSAFRVVAAAAVAADASCGAFGALQTLLYRPRDKDINNKRGVPDIEVQATDMNGQFLQSPLQLTVSNNYSSMAICMATAQQDAGCSATSAAACDVQLRG
jgi:hypothetical protein